MTEGSELLVFSFATLLVVVAPGPGMLYVISRGLAGGRRTGVVAAMGTSAGIAIHIVAAGLGLSLIIYASRIGFQVTKWAGGGYLLFLAWKAFTRRQELTLDAGKPDAGHSAVFWQGALVNALNPKVALFFVAFIPQFVHPNAETVAVQTIVRGALFMGLTVMVFTAYGLSAAMIRKWVMERPRLRRGIDWAMGSLFVALGVRLVFSVRQ